MPACAGYSEEIHIVADVTEDVEGCVMLEEEVHLDADAADVLEHVRELHVLRIRAEPIEAAEYVSAARWLLLCGRLTCHDHQSGRHKGSAQMTPLCGVDRSGWYSNGSTRGKHPAG